MVITKLLKYMVVHAKVNHSLPFIPKFKQEKRPKRWIDGMVHWPIERMKLRVHLKHKSSIRHANITFMNTKFLSGTWFSPLWFVTKANDFYPAFIYELVLLYWLELNKERVLSIFNHSRLLWGCFLSFFHPVKLQSLSTTLLQLATIRCLAVITTSISDSKMNH